MVTRTNGVTLIELMIVVAIVALIALFAVPMGSRWIAGSQVAETKALLLQGYSTARALALRNPSEATDNQAAAGLKLSDTGVLLVCTGPPNDAACTPSDKSGIVVWQTDVVRGIGVSVTVATIALTNRGIPLGSAPYSIAKGEENVSGNLVYE
jgi:prepilin-type N-terminal cleavage/methylation domain-containing protein